MSSFVCLEPLCDSIFRLNKNIQSVAVINKQGRTVEKISKPHFAEQFPDHLSELFCMSCVLQMSMGRDFDEQYGPINYHVSERQNLTMLTFPIYDHVLLLTTKKNISPISLAREIVTIIDVHRKQAMDLL